jgi:CRP/FNR family transcriptional regulator, cyclic AMP receptor protein
MPSQTPAVEPGRWPAGTFMAALRPATATGLLGLALPREHPPGYVLLQQGQTGKHVHLLRSSRADRTACVKVTATVDNGSEALLGIRVSGDIVGELAMVRGDKRTATVTTCNEVFVHTIPGTAFQDFLRSHEEARTALDGMIAERLVWANQRRLDFAGYDTRARLARVLEELVARHGVGRGSAHELGVNLSQAELGMLIGAKKDAASRAMRELRDEGAIAFGYREVTVTDLKTLHDCANPVD